MATAKDVLREELVLLNYEAGGRDEVLQALAALLLEDGATKDTYLAALLKREAEFPTGLPTEGIKVALPHAGAEHVNYSALAVAILSSPVKFYRMDEPQTELDVEVVLMLANADPNEQVQTLRRLCEMFGEPEALQALKAAGTASDVVRLLRQGCEVSDAA